MKIYDVRRKKAMNCKRALWVAAMVSVMMCTLRIGKAQPGGREPGGDRHRNPSGSAGRILTVTVSRVIEA